MFQRLSSLQLNPIQLTWGAALFFTTIGNVGLWQMLWSNLEINSLHGLLFFISLPVFFFCLINLLFTPVLALPYVRKPLLALLVVISASCSYFMFRDNVLIDRSMVQNVFETSQAELASYFSIPLLLTILVLGVLPAAVMVCLPTKQTEHPFQNAPWWLGNVLVTLAVLAAVTMLFYKDYTSLLRNNLQIRDQVLPFNFVRSTKSYLKRYLKRTTSQLLRTVAEDATRPVIVAGKRPKLVIAVVGETARAQSFQMVYAERMLGKSIDVLQRYSGQRDVAMIHLSDHGESLGERGIYLHGTPYLIVPKEQTQVPMVMWFSPAFVQDAGLNLTCLRNNAKNKDYSHDNFYHSRLGLFAVQSRVYQPELDVFAPCRELM
ncbi:phosphoethanolamine transferase domain-containing protein [Pectobacterium aroidearum]|uniref:phosphoethanolamine transferase n=1 Tax=Pectobacterium aroidearum TaxID=1201031 RepID=UPI0032EC52CA